MLCIKSILNGKDTLGVLPTGYGKTLIFQLLPHFMDNLRTLGYVYPLKPIIVIVSPLIALIEEQIERCQEFGPSAQLLEPFTDAVMNGNIRYLFSSPETLLLESCRKLFLSETYRKNVAVIVIDEAHSVVKWYVQCFFFFKGAFRRKKARISNFLSLSLVTVKSGQMQLLRVKCTVKRDKLEIIILVAKWIEPNCKCKKAIQTKFIF